MYKKLLVFLFLVFYATASLCYSKNQSKSNVLILHSYHIGYQWTDNLQPGITETLEENENLEREKAGDIPVTMESPNRCIFNGQVLHKHNISEKLLPDHSIIIKRTAEHLMDK